MNGKMVDLRVVSKTARKLTEQGRFYTSLLEPKSSASSVFKPFIDKINLKDTAP